MPLLIFPAAPVAEEMGSGVLGEGLRTLVGDSRQRSVLLSVVLVGVQGIQINTWATRHRLSRSVTQFPGLFVVLVSALVYCFHDFSTFQAANVFLLFALLALGHLYRQREPAVSLFNAGAWMGVASLFRPEYLLFMPAALAAVSILRRLEVRAVLQLLTGTGLIYFFLLVWGYVTGQVGGLWHEQFNGFGLPTFGVLAVPDRIGLAVVGLLLIGVILSFGRINLMLNIEGSKNADVLAWLLLCSLPVVLVCNSIEVVNAQVLVVPLGGLLGLGMAGAAPSRAEAVHLVLFAVALVPLFIGW